MEKQELAQAIIELWDDYLHEQTSVFQPTMTDFVVFLRRKYGIQEVQSAVKPTRTSTDFGEEASLEQILVTHRYGTAVKSDDENEASVSQCAVGDALTTIEKAEIRKLYRAGYSSARVRQMLGLKVPLERIYRIAEDDVN